MGDELEGSEELVGVDLLSTPGSLFGSSPFASTRPSSSSKDPRGLQHRRGIRSGEEDEEASYKRGPSPLRGMTTPSRGLSHEDQAVGPGRSSLRPAVLHSSTPPPSSGGGVVVEWPSASSRPMASGSASKREGGTPGSITPRAFLRKGSRKEPSALNRRQSSDSDNKGTPSSTSQSRSPYQPRISGDPVATPSSLGGRGGVESTSAVRGGGSAVRRHTPGASGGGGGASGKKKAAGSNSGARDPAPWVGLGIVEDDDQQQWRQQVPMMEKEEGQIVSSSSPPPARNGVWSMSEEELGREDEVVSSHASVDRSPQALSEVGDWEIHKDLARQQLMEFASLERRLLIATDQEEEDAANDGREGEEEEFLASEMRGGSRDRAGSAAWNASREVGGRVHEEEGEDDWKRRRDYSRADEKDKEEEAEEERKGNEWLGLEDMVKGCSQPQQPPPQGATSRDTYRPVEGRQEGRYGKEGSAHGEEVQGEPVDWMSSSEGLQQRNSLRSSGLPGQRQEELDRQEEEEMKRGRGARHGDDAAAAADGTYPQEPPPTSGLVKRLFGSKQQAPTDGTPVQAGRSGVGTSSTTKCLGCSQKRAATLKVEQQLAELEAEVESVRKEKAAATAAREHYDRLVQQLKKDKQQWLDGTETERRKFERWCDEQRQAIVKEKKAAARQLSRTSLDELNKAAVTRQEKVEIEALKATIEKMKVDEEARKRKQTLSSRRQQSHAKEQQKRIDDLVSQVEALEQNRLEMLERTDLLERQVLRQAMAAKRAATPGSGGMGVLPTTTTTQQATPSSVVPPSLFNRTAVDLRRKEADKPASSSKQQQGRYHDYEREARPEEEEDEEEEEDYDDEEEEDEELLDVSGGASSLNVSSASSAGHKRKRGIALTAAATTAPQQQGRVTTDSPSALEGTFHAGMSGGARGCGTAANSTTNKAAFPSPPPQYDPTKYTPQRGASNPMSSSLAWDSRPPPYVPDNNQRQQQEYSHNNQGAAPVATTTGSALAAAAAAALGASLGSSIATSSSSLGESHGQQQQGGGGGRNQSSNASSFGKEQPVPSAFGEAGRLAKMFPDGRQAIWYANGTYKQIFPDGRTVVRFSNGDLKTTVASTGTVIYYYAEAKTTQTTLADGMDIFEFPSGQMEKHYPDGTKEISVPDSKGGAVRTIISQEESNKRNSNISASPYYSQPSPATTGGPARQVYVAAE